MFIHFAKLPTATATTADVTHLNGVWLGQLTSPTTIPQIGHLLFVFPLEKTAVSCANITIPPRHYLMHMQPATSEPLHLNYASQQNDCPYRDLLLLWISPQFIGEMAHFLDIPPDLQQLLHNIPLPHGDQLSDSITQLAHACQTPTDRALMEELFLEVVGSILQLMRVRHQALQRLSQHKAQTVADLLPILLQARQFVEANYAQPLKLQDVADYVGLSPYHFTRLFKTAFDITLRQYLIRLRLDAARGLLIYEHNSVTDTAFQVGYGSLSSFIHAFTKQFGLSPAKYQTRMKIV